MNPQNIPEQNPQNVPVPEVPMIPVVPVAPIEPIEIPQPVVPVEPAEPVVQDMQTNPVARPVPTPTYIPQSPIIPNTPTVPRYVPTNFNANFSNVISSKPATHSSKKKYIVILSVALILFAGIYSVYAFVLSPKVALPSAIAKIDNAKFIHSGIKFTLSSSNASLAGTSLSVVNDIDRSVAGNTQFGSTIDVINPYASASAEIKFVDNVLYGRIVSVPNAYARYVSSIGNGWYSVSLDNLRDTAMQNGITLPEQVVGDSNIASVYEQILASGILKNQKFTGITKYNDAYVRQYSMEVDKDVLLSKVKSTSMTGVGNAYVSGIESLVKQQLDSVVISPVIISVDLFSGSLRGVDTGIFASPDIGDGYMKDIGILLSWTYDDSILSLAISAPQNAKSLDTIISDYLLKKKGVPVTVQKAK